MKQANKVTRFPDYLIHTVCKKASRLSSLLLMITLFIFYNNMIFAQQKDVEFDWVRTAGADATDMGKAITLDNDGYVYHTGGYTGTVTFGSGQNAVTLNSGGTGMGVYIAKLDEAGNLIWAKGFESDASTTAWGNAITVDNKGHIYITGEFVNGNMKFDSITLLNQSWYDGFIAKLDTGGKLIWAKQFGSIGSDRGYGIDADTSGNIYVTGHYGSTVFFDNISRTAIYAMDIFVAKLNPDGNYLWVTSMGGNGDDYGAGISLDDAGNVFSVNYYQDSATFGSINLPGAFWTVAVTRLDKDNGNVIWAKRVGGNLISDPFYESVLPQGITADKFGNVYTTGLFQRTADFNPSTAPADTFFLSADPQNTVGGDAAYILKLDTLGNFVWAKAFQGSGRTWGYGITTDQAGNVYSTGDLMATMDFDPGPDSFHLTAPYRIDTLIFIPPSFLFTITVGNMDAYISKLDSSGNFVWAKTLGGLTLTESYARGHSLAVNQSGAVYSAGEFIKEIDFNPDNDTFNVSTITDVWDIYIHKLYCSADTGATIEAQADCNGYPINGLILTEPGVHHITYTSRSGCDSIVLVDLFVILPEPEITIEVDTLSTTKTYVSYQWLKNGELIPGAINAKYTVTENANYQVIVTDENGCTDTSDIYPVTNHGSYINDIGTLGQQISIHPNPTQDVIYISSPLAVDVTITGIDGRSIAEIKNARYISMKQLADGIYFLKITNKEGKLIKTEKIVKHQ